MSKLCVSIERVVSFRFERGFSLCFQNHLSLTRPVSLTSRHRDDSFPERCAAFGCDGRKRFQESRARFQDVDRELFYCFL